jgi:hypothetical protein
MVMRMPQPFSERSQSTQVLLAVVLPVVLGALAGVMLGVSAGIYIILSVIAALGAMAAGLEHVGAVPAAYRGLLAGVLYGTALLIAHDIAGTEELVELSNPPLILVVLTSAIGALLAAIGGSMRARQELGPEAQVPPSD